MLDKEKIIKAIFENEKYNYDTTKSNFVKRLINEINCGYFDFIYDEKLYLMMEKKFILKNPNEGDVYCKIFMGGEWRMFDITNQLIQIEESKRIDSIAKELKEGFSKLSEEFKMKREIDNLKDAMNHIYDVSNDRDFQMPKIQKEIEELREELRELYESPSEERIKELERQLNLQSRYRLDHRNDIDELKKVIQEILETEENQNLINSSLLKLITGNNKETINSELFPDIEASNFEKEQIENRKKCNHESIHLITTGLVMCASCETLSNAPNGDIYKKWVIKNREEEN